MMQKRIFLIRVIAIEAIVQDAACSWNDSILFRRIAKTVSRGEARDRVEKDARVKASLACLLVRELRSE